MTTTGARVGKGGVGCGRTNRVWEENFIISHFLRPFGRCTTGDDRKFPVEGDCECVYLLCLCLWKQVARRQKCQTVDNGDTLCGFLLFWPNVCTYSWETKPIFVLFSFVGYLWLPSPFSPSIPAPFSHTQTALMRVMHDLFACDSAHVSALFLVIR